MPAYLADKDHALVDNVFEEYFVFDVIECFQRCLANATCLSFNFECSGVGLKNANLTT